MTDSTIRLKFRGEHHEVDLGNLTFGEGRALEKVTGKPIGDMGSKDIGTLQAFLWVALRRTQPDLKFSDLDDMPIGDLVVDEDPEPEEEAPENPSSPAAD